MVTVRVVFEAEASGGSKAGGLPYPPLSPFHPLPLSIPPKFSDKPVGRGKVRSSEGEVPRLPPTNTALVTVLSAYYMFYTLHVVEPLRYDSVLIKETNE